MTSSTQKAGTARIENSAHEPETYEFFGRHLLVSYLRCDAKMLLDAVMLSSHMRRALEAAKATVIDSTFHIFPNGGFTAVFMLAQSHASIHTYPEHGSCFVDFFTCGKDSDPDAFDSILQSFLKPEAVEKRLLTRHTNIE
jgi:S-adenosylmethionine decarboxylase proenzyme